MVRNKNVMGEQYVYLIRLLKEDYSLPHIMAFLEPEVAEKHFDLELKRYRKKGWNVDDEPMNCGGYTVRRAKMARTDKGEREEATLVLDQIEITKS